MNEPAKKKHTDGHRLRLRERFLRAGLDGLQDYEAIELLLMFGIPRRDVKPLAKELLEAYGSLEKLLDATPADLLDKHGMGASSATLIVLIRELCAKYLEQKVRNVDVCDSPAATERFLRMKLGGGRKETFMVIFLNSQNHVLEFQIFPGTVDRAAIYPREIAEKCLRVGASVVIIAHNHPSGVCVPSDSDLLTTRRILAALKTINVTLLDHLIVTPSVCLSLRGNGTLKKLEIPFSE
ncbi:MAG: DNA repair protein RadC [Victivallales bacterium]|jgi:DNA repair protein RadC|nr:DNA repair protein RadC [Victivallales bacterium]